MFRRRPHRFVTLLLLSTYAASNVLTGWLHDHPARDHHASACCAHAHVASAHHAADEHEHAGDCEHRAQIVVASAGDSHDDDCTICRFVGQRVLPAVTCTPAGVEAVAPHVAVAIPAEPLVRVARLTHSRAPPAAF
ncbi:MAG TPA: hypothetical protein VL175_01675 [Pirellulales bacterium]|jgi:hypothetical protein|nr:hypothetical protein [Pirellulales bacterium]